MKKSLFSQAVSVILKKCTDAMYVHVISKWCPLHVMESCAATFVARLSVKYF